MARLTLPAEMRTPPQLPGNQVGGPPEPRYALLINPFYRKDPHASFGKHVLTPTLVLTSIAGATPPHWRLRYWDENLRQGPPPTRPFPQVVENSVATKLSGRIGSVGSRCARLRV